MKLFRRKSRADAPKPEEPQEPETAAAAPPPETPLAPDLPESADSPAEPVPATPKHAQAPEGAAYFASMAPQGRRMTGADVIHWTLACLVVTSGLGGLVAKHGPFSTHDHPAQALSDHAADPHDPDAGPGPQTAD